MLKIITINTNGIRSAVNKGFHLWLAKQDADIVCIQELKAQPDEVPDEINLDGTFYRYVHCAEKKGYSAARSLPGKNRTKSLSDSATKNLTVKDDMLKPALTI